MPKNTVTFIDLFSGLGGFHLALKNLGCKCVFASELREDLRALYKINFPDTPIIEGDITKVDLSTIPHHDILCAGFPCQPFSQAGKRQGFNDKEGRGNMFDYICEIIRLKKKTKPTILLLENVANLKGHDEKRTWNTIKEKLDALGYYVYDSILSPHQYGHPQHRKRIYIVGIKKELIDDKKYEAFVFPEEHKEKECSIHSIIDKDDTNIQPLNLKTLHQLKVWQMFLDQIKIHKKSIPSFPIWAMEFGANYPFIENAPYTLEAKELKKYNGKLGIRIIGPAHDDCIQQLPVYARTDKSKRFPDWKIRYIQQNRDFFSDNENWIPQWRANIMEWDNSHQKFEWNCGSNDNFSIKDKIVQFRASGIRVKMPTYSPALNLVGTQVPILPWIKLPLECIPNYSDDELEQYGLTREDISYGRYLSIKEAAALQGMGELQFSSLSKTRIYEALGNAVNTQVVQKIATKLINIYCYGKNTI